MSLDIAAIDQRVAELLAGSRAAARDEAISVAAPLGEHLAKRFRGRGEPIEDLVQVAMIGLVKAIDRFDLSREIRFSTYATPTVIGEIKRYFRDTGWRVHLPRRLQERALAARAAERELEQRLSRRPTVAEVSEATGLELDEVIEAMEAAAAYSPASLDARAVDGDEPHPHDVLGDEDPDMAIAEGWATLAPHLAKLDPRDRRILYLRFVKDYSQSEIADDIGCSQMHVSRLLARTLRTLREAVGATAEPAAN